MIIAALDPSRLDIGSRKGEGIQLYDVEQGAFPRTQSKLMNLFLTEMVGLF